VAVLEEEASSERVCDRAKGESTRCKGRHLQLHMSLQMFSRHVTGATLQPLVIRVGNAIATAEPKCVLEADDAGDQVMRIAALLGAELPSGFACPKTHDAASK
jgi:hypothetical protein